METSELITPEVIESGMTYREYRDLIETLLGKGKTTGDNQSEQIVEYAKLNNQRMNRLDKTVKLTDEAAEVVKNIEKPQIWIVLTEGWCGDAAQNVPVIAKMAAANDQITLRLLLRDKHLDIMDAYLTNGGRSIPKLIAVDAESYEELFNWGPRPEPAQEIMIDFKNNPEGRERQEVYQQIHKWYADDKSHTMQKEIADLVKESEK